MNDDPNVCAALTDCGMPCALARGHRVPHADVLQVQEALKLLARELRQAEKKSSALGWVVSMAALVAVAIVLACGLGGFHQALAAALLAPGIAFWTFALVEWCERPRPRSPGPPRRA